MAKSIASHVTHCLDLFRDGLSATGTGTGAGTGTVNSDPSQEESLRKIRDEHTRFKIWSGNIGAHRVGMSSLDYRLRDSSHIHDQIIQLLEDLRTLLEDIIAIISGKKIPWDQFSSDEDSEDDDNEDSKSKAIEIENDDADTEISQLTLDVTDVINCLLRMSITIRDPSRHDRFTGSRSTEMLHFEPFDIQHVCSKLDGIDPELADRLGKAITRRRQYFKYREAHYGKLPNGLDDYNTHDVAPETIASSIPDHLKDKIGASGPVVTKLDDGGSESGFSQTSYALTMANDEQRHIPPLPEQASKGPFQCPFCFMIVAITSRSLWKKHVYGDLRPYICLVKDCKTPDREYTRQHEWIQHMTDSHWKVYKCPFSCDVAFTSSFDCKNHIISEHRDMVPPSHVDDFVELGVRLTDSSSILSCPLCPEKSGSIKQYQHHVGRHQQQLALFALPNLDCGDEQSDDYDGGGSNEDTGHSTESSNWGSGISSHQVKAPLTAEASRRARNRKSSKDEDSEDPSRENTQYDEAEESKERKQRLGMETQLRLRQGARYLRFRRPRQ
ncbi:putative transcription factor [Rosellinia necatrix]|uniref:Putative transcription factor n=1 Tax=Rosellinia necatrix TaxID=77044 RepID=A0A1W2TWV1_ROSNE|nr:putative transcription factor [Rosellinia necatrix]